MNFLELIGQNFKLSPIKNNLYYNKYFYFKNIIDDNFNKNRTFKISNNIYKANNNLKLVKDKKAINNNNELPLIRNLIIKIVYLMKIRELIYFELKQQKNF